MRVLTTQQAQLMSTYCQGYNIGQEVRRALAKQVEDAREIHETGAPAFERCDAEALLRQERNWCRDC